MLLALRSSATDLQLSDDEPLRLPRVGSYQLRVISPTVLELTYVTAVRRGSERAEQWDFVNRDGRIQLPAPEEFIVTAGDNRIDVKALGFKRRALYAPFKQWDLRVGNELYLQLARSIQENELVEVKNANQKLWPTNVYFTAKAQSLRWSPVVM
jgi:hypothetical protein